MVTRPLVHPILIAIAALVPLALALRQVMSSVGAPRAKAARAGRLSAIVALVAGMAMRPMVPNGRAQVDALDVDCMFVIDTTLSMWADDYSRAGIGRATRMDGAKAIARHMVDAMAGASFSIITFDHTGRVLAPSTQDLRGIDDAIDIIDQPSQWYAQGSSMSSPIPKMELLLQSAQRRSDRKMVVIFISDGEVTDGSEVESYAGLAQYVDDGLVIGLGTEQGGTMDIRGRFSSYVVEDPETGQPAVSRIDEATLTKIADELGIGYVHATSETDVDALLESLRGDARHVPSDREELLLYDDAGWVLAIPAGALLAWEEWSLVRRRRL